MNQNEPTGILEPVTSFADTVIPGELLNDAPGDDRTEHALRACH